MKLLVSACLLGEKCRYDGSDALCGQAAALALKYELVPVCPEQLGGLPTPRKPSEIVGERVLTVDGVDITDAFENGAKAAAKLAVSCGCERALLKSKSPSCGCRAVYDGSFSGRLIPGIGLAAALLKEAGIELFDESEAQKL